VLLPDQLADALESGKYTRHKGELSAGPRNKKNCCIGVAVREVEGGLIPESAAGCHEEGLPYSVWLEANTPWMHSLNAGDPRASWVRGLLTASNDEGPPGVWDKFTIPFLRELKVNKNGQLSKRQTPRVRRCLEEDGSFEDWFDPQVAA